MHFVYIFQVFSTPYSMRYHLDKVHFTVKDNTPARCDLCNRDFANKHELNKHQKDKHLPQVVKNLQCDQCLRLYDCKQKLYKHATTVHGKKFPCKVCGKTYSKNIDARRHEDKVHYNKHVPPKHPCEVCGKLYSRKIDAAHHAQMVHFSKDEKASQQSQEYQSQFKCDVCDKSFPRKSYLTSHLRTHTSENVQHVVNCPHCHRGFHRRHNYERHMVSAHKVFRCGVGNCQKEYTVRKLFLRHLRQHDAWNVQLIEDKCSSCGKICKDTPDWEKHFSAHETMQCDLCDRKFDPADNRIFLVHMKKHANRQCKLCLKQFKTMRGLKDHLRIHDQLQCPECLIHCQSHGSLRVHIRQHHADNSVKNPLELSQHDMNVGVDNYKCDKCHKDFPMKEFLKDHDCVEEVSIVIPASEIKQEKEPEPNYEIVQSAQNNSHLVKIEPLDNVHC